MNLFSIIYMSLFLFAGFFVVVLIISFISYKLKSNRNKDKIVYDQFGKTYPAQEKIVNKTAILDADVNHKKQREINRIREQYPPQNTSRSNYNDQLEDKIFHSHPRNSQNINIKTNGNTRNASHYKSQFTQFENHKRWIIVNKPVSNYMSKDEEDIDDKYNDNNVRYPVSMFSADILNFYDDNSDNQFYILHSKNRSNI